MTVLNNCVPVVVSGTPQTLSLVLPAILYGILCVRVITASFRETQSLERLKDLPRVIGLVRGWERIWSHTCLSALIFIRGLCGVGQAPTRKRKPSGRAGAPPPCSDPQVVLHAPAARWWSQPICLSTCPQEELLASESGTLTVTHSRGWRHRWMKYARSDYLPEICDNNWDQSCRANSVFISRYLIVCNCVPTFKM